MDCGINQFLLRISFLGGGLLFLACTRISAQWSADKVIHTLRFQEPFLSNGQSATSTLTSNEVLAIHQDREGFIWIATRYGFNRYDGYQIKNYKLPGFSVQCLADDYERKIWLGSNNGVYILNKVSNKIEKIRISGLTDENISTILVARDQTVWIGTESGVYFYSPKTAAFQACDRNFTKGILPSSPVKSMIEDSQGDIWIGTWDKGLYRYSPKERIFFAYPQMNEYNSAHTLFEDHRQNIWVGTWRGGLYLLKNPKDMQNVSWECFRHSGNDPNSLSDNIIYSLSSDPYTNTLWAGTRTGLSILNLLERKSFINYRTDHSAHHLPYDEVSSLLRSTQNEMWIGTIGGGVYTVDTRPPLFNPVQLTFPRNDISSQSIRHLFVDSQGWVWIGISAYGMARCKSDGSQAQFWKDIPEFATTHLAGGVLSIIERKATGEIWLGTPEGQIFIYKQGEKVRELKLENLSLATANIPSLMEDSEGNCWIGTAKGIHVLYGNGKLFSPELPAREKIKLSECFISTQSEDREGAIWIGTKANGIIRIQGTIYQPSDLKYTTYNSLNKSFPDTPVLCIHQDRTGRIWAGTKGRGLFLFNPGKGHFEGINDKFHITTDVVSNIEEDESGNLWLGTNKGLVKFTYLPNEEPIVRIYSAADGLQNSYPNNGTSFNVGGKLYFGGTNGFCTFNPHTIKDTPLKAPLVITDIKILNTSIEKMDSALRKRISSETPEFTKSITIPYQYNNFSIEFAALTYNRSQQIHYAYILKGYDKEWQYVDETQRFAHYNNLPAGDYTFYLKAANSNGIWNGNVKEIKIVVLPPYWATWWAILLYLLLFFTIGYFTYRTVRNRIRLKNQLRLSNIEQAKAEEVNHAKLQFFTNLTHELMTPLSILSASIDELRTHTPENKAIYSIMVRNVNRLIRLLQQILEFRKAESGNLKLRVSKGDLVTFLHNEAEAFRPLIKKRKLNLSVTTNTESLEGFFDPDKLDKIVYNLLSNAAKYNRENGSIQVRLNYLEKTDSVEFRVADNGKGISPEAQKNLFTRFYEGDYRRFNTIGTGIGLSLTQDLVTLHHGSIRVESEIDKGTTFIVVLPIGKEAFEPSQIDEEVAPVSQNHLFPTGDSEDTEAPAEEQFIEEDESRHPSAPKQYTILLVEDNEELLHLITKLLQNEYHIHTAANGEEAMKLVEKEDIDLIVSDLMMPVMDGITFCRKLKSNVDHSHIPLIVLTAKSTEEDRAEAYESGADGYIRKPFNLTVLHAKIRNLLSKKERNASDFRRQVVFEIKDLNYNTVDEDFLQRAIDCVNKSIENPEFDLQQLAVEMQTSKTNLNRKLKSLTGLPPASFIRNIRMKAACKLMSEKKNLRINEVAYSVGFKDAKYFSTCFRKEFGIQPKEFITRFTGPSQ